MDEVLVGYNPQGHKESVLVGYNPQGHKESDTTERAHFHFLVILTVVKRLLSGPHDYCILCFLPFCMCGA